MVTVAQQVLKHGGQGYRNGCRCDTCKEAMREIRRVWASTGARSNRPPVQVVDDQIGHAWRTQAACNGHPTEWWFDSSPNSADYRQAMAICAVCPVRTTCLEWAMQWPVHDLHGIWGGTSQRERARINDQRKAPTWHAPTLISIRTTGRLSGTRFNESPETSTR